MTTLELYIGSRDIHVDQANKVIYIPHGKDDSFMTDDEVKQALLEMADNANGEWKVIQQRYGFKE